MNFSNTDVRSILKKLFLIRLTEEEIVKNYGNQGHDQEMRCPVHLSIGQEGLAVGVCHFLEVSDKIFSTHRCHAHYLAKGGALDKMILEIYGKKGGCIDGRGGSMHLMDEKVGVEMSVPIVSSSIPLAVGNALSNKLNQNKSVTVSFFGDASVEEGIFHESANFAALHNLPVIFLCENNLYSCFTHLEERQPKRPIIDIAKAHDLNSHHIKSTNPFEIVNLMRDIIEKARNGKPSFVVIDTYRWLQHCGVVSDDHLDYRKTHELDKWLKIDPLIEAEKFAINSGNITNQEIKAMKTKLNDEIVNVFKIAKDAELPTPKMALNYVYSN